LYLNVAVPLRGIWFHFLALAPVNALPVSQAFGRLKFHFPASGFRRLKQLFYLEIILCEVGCTVEASASFRLGGLNMVVMYSSGQRTSDRDDSHEI